MSQGASEMSEKADREIRMSSTEYVQTALQSRIAPPSIGSVKARIRHASRKLGWSHSRTKDTWYADPRIALRAEELRDVEQQTGLRYGREELRSVEQLINQADALLDGPEADFYRPFFTALRAVARIADRAGNQGEK